MRRLWSPAILAGGLGLLTGGSASAAPDLLAIPAPPLEAFVTFGPGGVFFNAGATIKAAGATIPGASVSVDSNGTMITSAGLRYRSFQLSFTGGYPPVTALRGAGVLTPLGVLGKAAYGPAIVSAQYRFPRLGRLRPYVGGGPVFLFVFRNEDAAVRALRIKNATGVSVGGGVDYSLSRHWALNFDAKKIFLTTSASGNLDDILLYARIRLDPTLITAGTTYSF